MRNMAITCAFVLLIPVVAPSAFADGLTVTVGSTSVTAESKTLWVGDTAFFHSISWPDQPWIPSLEGAFEAARVEKQGLVEFAWPEGDEVPYRSIVIVANPRTGDYGIGTPDNFPLEVGQLPPDAFVLNEKTGQIDAIALRGRRYVLLIIRPGVGAWRLHVLDGSATDLDGVGNRQTMTSLSSAESNGDYGPPPTSLVSGDLVIAIDCRSMCVKVGGV